MKIFFESVVDEVIDNLVLEKTYFIIPNQRSKAFLKREILKKSYAPDKFWLFCYLAVTLNQP